MKLTQWSEEGHIRSFLELTHKEANTLLNYLNEQLEGGLPETLTHKLKITITDRTGKPKNTATGLLTIATFLELDKVE